MVKYRPHRGTLAEAMKEVIEVENLQDLIEHMQQEVIDWYPLNELPTLENTKIEPYIFDDRIGWDTHIVTVNGQAWGFTDGPF